MIAAKNLFRNKIRSLMTVLGVAVGVSIFVSLTSISNGFKSQLQDIVRGYSIDIVVLSKEAATPFGSRISSLEYDTLLKVEGIRSISAVIMGPTKSAWNPYFLLIGISSFESFATKLGIVEGRVFTAGKKEALIGDAVAKRFGLHANDQIALAGEDAFTITGIYMSGGRTFDGGAIVDLRDARRILKRDDSINMAFIQVAGGRNPKEVAERINTRFQGLSAIRGGEFVGEIRLIKVIEASALTISIISFLACCFIVVNTLMMAVTERTKEFGVLMAIGWGRFMIAKTILFEAILICLAGGILGNLIGIAQLWLFNYINPEGIGWWVSLSGNVNIFLQSLGLSALLGLVSSLYPALLTSKLLPAEALRYE
jgi:putative ABC transport system permease protein